MKNKKRILILSAMKEEIIPLMVRLGCIKKTLSSGEILIHPTEQAIFTFLVTGVGKGSVLKKLSILGNTNDSYDIVFFIGICGAVNPSFTIGDTIIPDGVVEQETHERIALMFEPRQKNKEKRFSLSACDCGDLITTYGLCGKEDKKKIRDAFPAVTAVDMEAFYVASTFSMQNVRLYVVKTVSDTHAALLPQERFIRSHFRTSTAKQSMLLLMHPVQTSVLFLLKMNIKKAIKANTAIVQTLINQYINQ